MARPKKYTALALKRAVDAYFNGISREVVVTEQVDSGQRDERGHVIYVPVAVKNRLGEEMRHVEYLVPPTVGGLCEHLGIHRSTWADWCDAKRFPEFADTTTRARGRMRAYLEEQLLVRKDVKGIIFDLQNNYGMSEKREIELGSSAAAVVAAGTLSERKAALDELLREFTVRESDL